MIETVDVLVSWRSLGLVFLIGFAPRLLLRVITRFFPPGDPRRSELVAEFCTIPRRSRPFWVVEQLELAICEGLPARLRYARSNGLHEPRWVTWLSGWQPHREDKIDRILAATVGEQLKATDPDDFNPVKDRVLEIVTEALSYKIRDTFGANDKASMDAANALRSRTVKPHLASLGPIYLSLAACIAFVARGGQFYAILCTSVVVACVFATWRNRRLERFFYYRIVLAQQEIDQLLHPRRDG